MSRRPTSKRNHPKPKAVLRLPDLDQAKSAVLNSLTSADAQRGYRHAIDEFVEWYCSEPRLSFSRTVVLRYRIHLESRHLAPGTINPSLRGRPPLGLRGCDCGLLSPIMWATKSRPSPRKAMRSDARRSRPTLRPATLATAGWDSGPNSALVCGVAVSFEEIAAV
jgi:hypothetical protein